MFDKDEIKKALIEAFPDSMIEVEGDDGVHFHATIVSSQFEGKTKIQQHKMVYDSLRGKMGNELHALALKTKEKDGSAS